MTIVSGHSVIQDNTAHTEKQWWSVYEYPSHRDIPGFSCSVPLWTVEAPLWSGPHLFSQHVLVKESDHGGHIAQGPRERE